MVAWSRFFAVFRTLQWFMCHPSDTQIPAGGGCHQVVVQNHKSAATCRTLTLGNRFHRPSLRISWSFEGQTIRRRHQHVLTGETSEDEEEEETSSIIRSIKPRLSALTARPKDLSSVSGKKSKESTSLVFVSIARQVARYGKCKTYTKIEYRWVRFMSN